MDRAPLGGGGMVGVQLVRHWREPDLSLTVIGSGSDSPGGKADYVRIETGFSSPSDLSALQYARFSRRFAAGALDYLKRRRADFTPEETPVIVNDISESPDLGALNALGYRVISIWHVDVVEFFNRFYLKNIFAPWTLARFYERMKRARLSAVLPEVLRLVFEKQRDSVNFSDRIVVPSDAMREMLGKCYGAAAAGKTAVVPWGSWEQETPDERSLSDLRARYEIGVDTRVLITLSRLSPEKGIEVVLRALARLESDPELARTDVCLLVCGEAAFMGGKRYAAMLREIAAGLKKFRVFFPGYLDRFEKPRHFALADLFVSASFHESYGLSVLEALRAGIPALASDVSGASGIITPAFGRLVRYPDRRGAPAAMAAELKPLLLHPEKLKFMGEEAKKEGARWPFERAARQVLEIALKPFSASAV